jgi:serine/threonine protein kinase
VDFGIAKLVGDVTITKTGGPVGTLAYMSPEQIRGEPVDHRTDLWSLGAVMYEMTSGERPFRADHAGVASNAIVQNQPKPLTSLRSGVPMDLERIVNRAMAKRKEDRYQTAADPLLIRNATSVRERLLPCSRIRPAPLNAYPQRGAVKRTATQVRGLAGIRPFSFARMVVHLGRERATASSWGECGCVIAGRP